MPKADADGPVGVSTVGPLDDPRGLLGSWRLRRTIDDRRSSARLEARGTLTLAPVDDTLVSWHEEGVLRRDDGEAPFHRRLRVERRPGPPDVWMVTFEDGRDFHPWTPGETVVHPCGADTYRGLVTSLPERGARAWRVTWEVAGPGKDYTMVTDLGPLDDRDAGDVTARG